MAPKINYKLHKLRYKHLQKNESVFHLKSGLNNRLKILMHFIY